MKIDIYIMHDKDENTPGAIKFNEPIKDALDNDEHLFVLENCIEDVLGYIAPKSEKPYKAYCYIKENWKEWEDVSSDWKNIIETIFNQGNNITQFVENANKVIGKIHYRGQVFNKGVKAEK